MGLFGKSSNDWNELGRIQFDNKQYAQALIYFNKAIEKNNYDHAIWSNKAQCLFFLQQYEQANACNEYSLKLNPNNIPALISKTALLNMQEKYSESLLVSDELLKLKHENTILAVILNNKSQSFEYMKQLDEAISCIDEAIRIDSDGHNAMMYHKNKESLLQIKNTPQVQDAQQDQQQNQESTFDGVLQELDITNNFSRLTWQNSEVLVGKLFEKKGYIAQVTGKSGDFGIDVEAKNTDEYLGIQVKHWISDVGFEDVAKTLGVSSKFNKVIIVSTKTGFTSQAIEFSQRDENRYRLELWDTNRFKLELMQNIIGK